MFPFTTILKYDDTLRYSKRLLQCLESISEEYIFFFHDTDIMIEIDMDILEKITDIMKEYTIDRVDIRNEARPATILFDHESGLVEYKSLKWRYNVGPSIWKVSTLRTIMQRFDKCYRTIEDEETQAFCAQFKFYHVTHPRTIESAYFRLSPWVVYIHMTSVGKLIPAKENGMCHGLKNVYDDILSRFSFDRPMKQHLYGLL